MAFIIILLVLVFFIALLSSLFNGNHGNHENHIPTVKRRRGVEVKSLREIEIMRNASKIVVTILSEITKLVEPGISTFELDK